MHWVHPKYFFYKVCEKTKIRNYSNSERGSIFLVYIWCGLQFWKSFFNWLTEFNLQILVRNSEKIVLIFDQYNKKYGLF